MVSALQSAALRGIDVGIVLPSRNNLPFVHWATRNMLWELLKYGAKVYYQPPPFSHTKAFVVDRHYVQFGSANLDPRSLRLNFELAVEVYDREFGAPVTAHFDEIRNVSRRVTLEELDRRPLPVRARDAVCWLFSPYL
jgi:cardiolipin synthase